MKIHSHGTTAKYKRKIKNPRNYILHYLWIKRIDKSEITKKSFVVTIVQGLFLVTRKLLTLFLKVKIAKIQDPAISNSTTIN